jgi:hypothetical protein
MSEVYSNAIPICNIHFPNKNIKMQKNTDNNSNSLYNGLHTAVDRNDPNITGSPPNRFVNTLQKRMNIYYENTIPLSINHTLRSRALSFDK